MNLEAITAWVWENKEIITLFAVVATAIGAMYQPTRDFLKALPKTVWVVIKYTILTAWAIIWPIRKLMAWLYMKFAAKHVQKFFDKVFDWFEKREAAKEKLHDNKNTIEVVDL